MGVCIFVLADVCEQTSLSRCLDPKSALIAPFFFFPRRETKSSESPSCFHTLSLFKSVNASPLTSQGCCLCTVLLCHRRLVPLGLCTLIPLSFPGAEPVFSQGSFLCEPVPAPLPFQAVTVSPLHTPNTMALKCENLKTKGPLASFEACCKTSKSPRTWKKGKNATTK